MGGCDVSIRLIKTKQPDPGLQQIAKALKPYVEAHPKAKIEAYRQNNVSVRIRIIDPDFQGLSLAEREEVVWPLLDQVPEDVVADVSLLLLLTPKEKADSLATFEFDHPTKSRL
jgi:stress-induced morphogen